ncbi:MAG: GAF domain-containing protein, partial [Anaerolineae bacterium]|nr:GAF domain-containing protein [Anaerolineae bacterium]
MSSEDLLSQQRPGVLRFGGARMALLDIEAGFWSLRRQLETLIGQRLTDSVLQQAGANGGASFAQAFGRSGQAADGERALRDCVAAYEAAGFGRFEIEAVEWPIGRLLIRADDSFEAWMIRQHKESHGLTACAYTAGVLVGFVNVLTGRRDIVCVERACQASGAEHCLFELLPAEAAGGAPVVSLDPDPGLSRQLNLLESLFDRMPMGIAIFDQDYILRRYNPTWAGFADRYAPPSAVDIAPGVYYFDLLPGTEPTVLPLFEKVMAGEVIQLEAMRLESEGVVSYWDVVLAPILEGDEVAGILNVTIDATERVEAHQELETALRMLQQREERLARVMKGINDGIWDWNIETGEVYFSPRWKSMLGYAEGEITNRFESWKRLIHPDDLERASTEIEEHLQGRTPLYYLEHRLRHKDGSYRWILARGQAVRDQEGQAYRLVGSHTDISDQKRAEAALQYRAAFESIVSSISTDFINMPLEEIDSGIHQALRVVGEFMGVDRSYVFRFSEDYGWMDCTHEWSAPGVEPQIDSLQGLSVEELVWSNRQLLRGESLHIPRVADLPPEAGAERQEFERQGIQSLIAVPMVYRGATVGFVGFDSVREPKVWSEDSIQLLHLVAAVFVNALEHKQAQEVLHAAYQSLEQRVDERTRALASLLEVSHNVASTLELGPLLEVILDQLQTVVDYTGASVLTLDDGCLAVRAYRGPIDRSRVLTLRFPLADAPANQEVVRLQEPVIIPDVRSDTAMARRFQDGAGQELDTTFGYVRSWLGVPLMVKEEVMGMLTLDHEEPDFYGPPQAGLVHAFANQVAVAIENARLYEAEQERLEESERRRRVAEGLRGVLAILNSERPLDDILNYIVEQARHLMGCQAAVVYRLALEQGLINIEVASGMPEAFQRLDAMPYVDTEPNRAAVSGQTFAIEDVQERWAHLDLDLGEQDPSVQEWASIVGQHFGAYL